jgi:hypothetical protein
MIATVPGGYRVERRTSGTGSLRCIIINVMAESATKAGVR